MFFQVRMISSKPYVHHFQKMADTGTIRGVGRISLEEPKKADVESGSPVKFYTACIRSVLEYSCRVFHTSLSQYLSHEMEYNYGEESTQLQKATAKAKLGTLFERRETLNQILFSQIETTDVNERHKLWNLLPPKPGPCEHEQRHERVYSLPLIKTKRFKNSFNMHHAAKVT